MDQNGGPLRASVDIGGSLVIAQIWEARVGRISIYLPDTNIEENSPEDRDMRMKQEILLGVGGIRTLRVLGINPCVTNMNEGHSAFLGLERIRILIKEEGLSFAEAHFKLFTGRDYPGGVSFSWLVATWSSNYYDWIF